MRLDNIAGFELPWVETLSLVSPRPDVPDVNDDLSRELAFYQQALHTVMEGRERVKTTGQLFTRPNDFFAEMVKSDGHMLKVLEISKRPRY
jgi:rRNA-processing protein EBP2